MCVATAMATMELDVERNKFMRVSMENGGWGCICSCCLENQKCPKFLHLHLNVVFLPMLLSLLLQTIPPA